MKRKVIAVVLLAAIAACITIGCRAPSGHGNLNLSTPFGDILYVYDWITGCSRTNSAECLVETNCPK